MSENVNENLLQRVFRKEVSGIPLAYFIIMSVLIILFWQVGKLKDTGIVGAFAFMWAVGFALFIVGEKLPIWKEYVGGGMIMAFFGSALLVHYGLVSSEDAVFLTASVIDNKFMYLLLVGLISTSILSVPSKVLLKSLFSYIPIILVGLVVASLLGLITGWIVGIEPSKIITHYILPIMGGGNGAGAIPMSEIYSDVTGHSSGEYYSFAISVLTLANIISIFVASSLNVLGKKFPALTGNGKLLITNTTEEPIEGNSDSKIKLNTHGALFFNFALMLFCFLLYALVPSIHVFAWVVFIVIVINLLNIMSPAQKKSLIVFSEWGMRVFLVLVLVAVGLMTDLEQLLAALNLSNLVVCTSIVLGAVLGTSVVARYFGCYPIEAAICAGLCMANRGGTGDLEVLSASKRMELFPYAQVSSRIGGGIVLFVAGNVFALLL
jgi:Na+/citrate or Na+/malate symporter